MFSHLHGLSEFEAEAAAKELQATYLHFFGYLLMALSLMKLTSYQCNNSHARSLMMKPILPLIVANFFITMK